MIAVHTHDTYRRTDGKRTREFFVAGVQPELSGQGGVVTLVYRDTGFVKRVRFDRAEQFFATAVRVEAH